MPLQQSQLRLTVIWIGQGRFLVVLLVTLCCSVSGSSSRASFFDLQPPPFYRACRGDHRPRRTVRRHIHALVSAYRHRSISADYSHLETCLVLSWLATSKAFSITVACYQVFFQYAPRQTERSITYYETIHCMLHAGKQMAASIWAD